MAFIRRTIIPAVMAVALVSSRALAEDVWYNYFEFGPLYEHGSTTAGVTGTCFRTTPAGVFTCWIAAFYKLDNDVTATSPAYSRMRLAAKGTLTEVWDGVEAACGHTTDVLQINGPIEKAKNSCVRMISTFYPRPDVGTDEFCNKAHFNQVTTTIRESPICTLR
jgi:hypothetical protein